MAVVFTLLDASPNSILPYLALLPLPYQVIFNSTGLPFMVSKKSGVYRKLNCFAGLDLPGKRHAVIC